MNSDFVISGIEAVIFIGKNEYSQDKLCFTGYLNSNELIFHFDTKETVLFNGKTLDVEENTIRFLPKGENWEYIVDREKRGDCIDVFFDTDVPVSDEAFVAKIENSPVIGNMFKKLFAIWVAKDEGYYFECVSLLYKIFAEMQKHNYIPRMQYNKLKPAIDYIEENFLRGKISVPYLAERCGISEAYLKKLFVKKFGISPMKYVIQLKINHACDLLRSERYSVTQVAELCAYESVYFFSRQFKAYTGVSPAIYQKKYRSTK